MTHHHHNADSRSGEISQRHVLVVGGAGYVGSVLIPHLLSRGASVTCADLLLYENGPLMLPYWGRPDFRFLHADLRDAACYESMLEGVTDVVLLASLVGDPVTKKYPVPSRDINVDGTKKFLDYCGRRNLARIVFVSTCSNYGMQQDDTPAAETSALNPLSVYARNKVEVEQYLMGGGVDVPFTILRFATAFGLSPRMRFDLTVSEFTRDVYLGRELLVYDPDTWRPYCHVKDMSIAIETVLEATEDKVVGEVFNTGHNLNNHTKRDIAAFVCKHIPGATISYKQHGSDPRNYRVDFSKIRECLGFEPRISVEHGVVELLQALRSGLFDGVDARPDFYGNRRIPLFEDISVGKA